MCTLPRVGRLLLELFSICVLRWSRNKLIIMGLICTAWELLLMNCFISNLPSTTRSKMKSIKIYARELLFLMILSELCLSLLKILSLSSWSLILNPVLNKCSPMNLFYLPQIILIIYNNKMAIAEDKLNDFFNNYFLIDNEYSIEYSTVPDKLNH